VSSQASELGGLLRTAGPQAVDRELYVRHARKDGRSVAILRAIDKSDCCVIEAEVFPEVGEPLHPGPYTFADARQATAFMTEAVEALMYLGCDVHAQ
jgi:2-keto-4-pentenoate hydratase